MCLACLSTNRRMPRHWRAVSLFLHRQLSSPISRGRDAVSIGGTSPPLLLRKKSPDSSAHKPLILDERALHPRPKRLIFLGKEPCIFGKRALYSRQKSPVFHPCKRALHFRQTSSVFSAKEPCILGKRDLYTGQKSPLFSANNPVFSAKEPYIRQTSPVSSAKEPYILDKTDMGWLRWVGCLKIQVSLQNTGLFCRALLQKRPIFLSILLIVATP